jgi:hypothetical protein
LSGLPSIRLEVPGVQPYADVGTRLARRARVLPGLLPVPIALARLAGPGDVLYDLVDQHLGEMLAASRERGRPVPAWVERAFGRLLQCGLPEFGFTWFQCLECGHDHVLPFSCKERTICPSCGGRRMNQFAANLVDHILPIVPVRQWVLSFPMRVRFLLARHPDLRNEVLDLFLSEVQAWLREATGEPAGKGGAVTAWQLAG